MRQLLSQETNLVPQREPTVPADLRTRLTDAADQVTELIVANAIANEWMEKMRAILLELQEIAAALPDQAVRPRDDMERSVEADAVARAKSEVESGEFDVQG